jgi:hypothetical protein
MSGEGQEAGLVGCGTGDGVVPADSVTHAESCVKVGLEYESGEGVGQAGSVAYAESCVSKVQAVGECLKGAGHA